MISWWWTQMKNQDAAAILHLTLLGLVFVFNTLTLPDNQSLCVSVWSFFRVSNCDQDIIHVLRDVMGCEVLELWHRTLIWGSYHQ